MKSPRITEAEQRALRDKAKTELVRLENHFANTNVSKVVDEFKNKFNICETVYKIILAKHQECKGIKYAHLKLQMTQAPFALSFAGYSFDRELLNNLFGSSSSKGKTAKKLRDATTHGMEQDAVNEIILRQRELFSYMDLFLETIKNFDSVVA